ncbi:1181_t:CDS:2 [Dentiscutata erythropus]|uniref:1181_t:CDS:1 n=1 Tax=Dentiscutata erythropus TaxID=1348616 RepID=A0A9N9EE93_9GLOM|nr:1181_t:CDS:2 [Dentiscutata erythropus]
MTYNIKKFIILFKGGQVDIKAFCQEPAAHAGGQVDIKVFCQEPAAYMIVKGTARGVLKRHRLMQKAHIEKSMTLQIFRVYSDSC